MDDGWAGDRSADRSRPSTRALTASFYRDPRMPLSRLKGTRWRRRRRQRGEGRSCLPCLFSSPGWNSRICNVEMPKRAATTGASFVRVTPGSWVVFFIKFSFLSGRLLKAIGLLTMPGDGRTEEGKQHERHRDAARKGVRRRDHETEAGCW